MTRYSGRTLIDQPSVGGWGQPASGVGYGVATGGTSSTITVGTQQYTLLSFTALGTLTVTKAGLFDLLIIGGGSSGVSGWYGNGRPGASGGGAGGAFDSTVYFDANQTVTIGAGGADPTGNLEYNIGSNSYVGVNLGSASASSRGDAPSWSSVEAVRVAQQYGFAGGTTAVNDGGGGGGQGQAGQGRNGGNGKDWSLWRGQTAGTTYYGGGGGGQNSSAVNGTGGLGGGAAGAASATANTGGGGGGGDGAAAGGGGSGIVLVRFKI